MLVQSGGDVHPARRGPASCRAARSTRSRIGWSRAHTEALGLPPAVSVLDRADSTDLMDLLRHDHEPGRHRASVPAGGHAGRHLLAVGQHRAPGPRRDRAPSSAGWSRISTRSSPCSAATSARKRERGLLDFDDLLLAWRSLLADPPLGPEIAARWDHVLVDEYQDVNQIQVDIVRPLRPDGRGPDRRRRRRAGRLRVPRLRQRAPAGPDRRPARTSRSSGWSTTSAPGSGCSTWPTRSGRSSADQRLMLHSDRDGRPARPQLVRCHDAPAEARAVVDAVLTPRRTGRPLQDQAVLMRTAHHSDLLEIELTARRVPFVKFGGLKFLEAAHVKDFVAAIRLLDNRLDEVAWYRLLRLHDGIGPARARDAAGPADRARRPDRSEHRTAPTIRDADARAATRTPRPSPLHRRWPGRACGDARRARRARGRRGSPTGPPPASRCCGRCSPPATRTRAARLGDLDRLVGRRRRRARSGRLRRRTDARPARVHRRPGRAAASGRRLPGAVDRALRQGPGVADSCTSSTWSTARSRPTWRCPPSAGLVEEQRLFYVAVTRAADELRCTRRCGCRTTGAPGTTSTASPRSAGSSTKPPWRPWMSTTSRHRDRLPAGGVDRENSHSELDDLSGLVARDEVVGRHSIQKSRSARIDTKVMVSRGWCGHR